MSLETIIITPIIPHERYRLTDGESEFFISYKQLLDLHNSLLHMFSRGGYSQGDSKSVQIRRNNP